MFMAKVWKAPSNGKDFHTWTLRKFMNRRRRTCFMHAPRKVCYRKIKLTYVNKTREASQEMVSLGVCVCVSVW